MLVGDMRARGIDVIATRQPGGTPLGRRLREAFLETEEAVAPLAELLLFAADRAQHVELLIRPALLEGRVVISDRYADATRAYQGSGRGFPLDVIEKVIELATGGMEPQLTLYFDVSVKTAMSRMAARSEAGETSNRMDLEDVEFYERVRQGYLEVAKKYPDRMRVINAASPVEEVHSNVSNVVYHFLNLN
jgi:dTMP kinase